MESKSPQTAAAGALKVEPGSQKQEGWWKVKVEASFPSSRQHNWEATDYAGREVKCREQS